MTQRLSEAEEAAALAASRLADRDAVIAQATSERTALSRAMEQNSRLKEQLMASTSANALPVCPFNFRLLHPRQSTNTDSVLGNPLCSYPFFLDSKKIF